MSASLAITRARARGRGTLAEVLAYRDLLRELVLTDLKLRYRRSALGFLWTMLNPLLMMLVLTAVFSTIMRFDIQHYAVLLLAGLLPWIFVSQSVTAGLGSVVGKGELLKKVYFPKVLLPLASTISLGVNFLLAFVPLAAILLMLQHSFSPALVTLPVTMLLTFMFAFGMACIFACLNVFFRDFTHMTEVLLQAWFYLSPIIYRVDMIPEPYRYLFAWNPMVYIIRCFRAAIYDGQMPSTSLWLTATALSAGTMLIGVVMYRRFESRFVFFV